MLGSTWYWVSFKNIFNTPQDRLDGNQFEEVREAALIQERNDNNVHNQENEDEEWLSGTRALSGLFY